MQPVGFLDPRHPPPADYYRDNFETLLEFVGSYHRSGLRAADDRYIAAWKALGRDAQRLLVRLFMRKGPVLRVDRLAYAEVADTRAALDELTDAGLIRLDAPVAADRLLEQLTLEELDRCFPAACAARRRQRKPEKILEILGRHTDTALRQRVRDLVSWLILDGLDCLERLQLLCFGSLRQDLSAFVLRDLGLVRYEDYTLGPDPGALGDPDVLTRYLQIAEGDRWLHRLEEFPGLHEALLQRLVEPSMHRSSERRRSGLLNELGRWHERRGDLAAALHCYRHSTRHPARERRVRLLRSTREPVQEDEAGAVLAAMASAPWCAEEEVFAARASGAFDRFEPLQRRRPLSVQGFVMTPGAIEAHALGEFATEGAFGLHLENALPLGLAGLAYWDTLYLAVPGAFTNLMQSAPHDLYWDDFAGVRREAIAGQRERLHAADRPADHLLEVHDRKSGIANALVNWRALPRTDLVRILAAMPRAHLLALVDLVIAAPGRCRTGFPDLFVSFADGRTEFIEVKGPNDHLQPQQRAWLQRLAAHDIPASVLKYTACTH